MNDHFLECVYVLLLLPLHPVRVMSLDSYDTAHNTWWCGGGPCGQLWYEPVELRNPAAISSRQGL